MALVDKTVEAATAPITHTPREYQEYPGSQYILPTDTPELQRLTLQHRTLKSMYGGRILWAPVELTEEDKVLDTGCGPGLWVLDLASSVSPAIQMTGIDIESRLFPPFPPPNLTFQIQSVLSLPADWSNTFTLIHQRLLLLALEIPQWPVALSEMHRVLRPGGWVQLAESTPWHVGTYPGRPAMEKLTALYRAASEARNLYVDCAYDMPKLLKDAGFVDIASESRMQQMGSWAGEDGEAMRKNHVAVLAGIKTPVLNAGGYGIVSSESEYDQLVEDLHREWEEVPGTDKEFIVFWARKPLN
ncbi:S-adenosyl-L-methionine-dependent methyltransferase [Mycena indigotica]|uniref:S-adenosyl-L-methionine-dependent methyltransferase n=1 Tax=Mycena indigotica TaxID=2126181 RepID=A0A8H6SAY7_9AGAR|nr:S-adenosyl-L-methionine-dependent methyltransferase [Mycena indigotica]KAF7295425.1 S-adenosyl-L-methionine-dependent methyltransferase [Mycena indigotica]